MAPVLSHEQTAVLGLATRLNGRFVDVQALTFETSLALTKDRSKTVVTGNPVRGSLKEGSRESGLQRFGFRSDMPVLFVTGGARGSSPLNERIEAILDDLLEHLQILHQTGATTDNPDFERLSARRQALPAETRDRYRVVERIRDEMADVYAMADLMLARAGAGTVAEIAYLGKTAILIPLPGSGGNEQLRNAEALSSIDGAVVIDQQDASPTRLREVILDLAANPERRGQIGANAARAGRPDAAARIADQLLALAEQRRARSNR